MPALRIFALREVSLRLGRNARGDGYIGAPHFSQQAVKQLGALLCIAKRRCNSQNLQLGTTERQSHGESIVNVIADVGINDDFLRERSLRRCRPSRTLSETARRRTDPRRHQRKKDKWKKPLSHILRPLISGKAMGNASAYH